MENVITIEDWLIDKMQDTLDKANKAFDDEDYDLYSELQDQAEVLVVKLDRVSAQ